MQLPIVFTRKEMNHFDKESIQFLWNSFDVLHCIYYTVEIRCTQAFKNFPSCTKKMIVSLLLWYNLQLQYAVLSILYIHRPQIHII